MIEAFTKVKIEELGDTESRIERACTVLAYQYFVRGGRSVIQIDGECYQIESDWLYTRHKRTGQIQRVSREELDKLPKTVSYQKPLNFFAKPPEATHKVSDVMQMVRRAGKTEFTLEYLRGRTVDYVQVDEYYSIPLYNRTRLPDTQQIRSAIQAEYDRQRMERLVEGYGIGERNLRDHIHWTSNPAEATRRSAWMGNMNQDIQIHLDAPIGRVNITGRL